MYTADNFKKADDETFILKISPDRDFKILQLTDLHLLFLLIKLSKPYYFMVTIQSHANYDNMDVECLHS